MDYSLIEEAVYQESKEGIVFQEKREGTYSEDMDLDWANLLESADSEIAAIEAERALSAYYENADEIFPDRSSFDSELPENWDPDYFYGDDIRDALDYDTSAKGIMAIQALVDPAFRRDWVYNLENDPSQETGFGTMNDTVRLNENIARSYDRMMGLSDSGTANDQRQRQGGSESIAFHENNEAATDKRVFEDEDDIKNWARQVSKVNFDGIDIV